MRARDDDDATHRWRPRALVPALLCAVAGLALSCDASGSCPPSTTGPTPRAVTPSLRPRYALASVAGQPLPVVLSQSGTARVRLVADTLLFAITAADTSRGTYTETVVLGVRDAAGVETTSRTVSPSREWTRAAGGGTVSLPAFSGGASTTAAASASPFEGASPSGGGIVPLLTVFTSDGRTFQFEAR